MNVKTESKLFEYQQLKLNSTKSGLLFAAGKCDERSFDVFLKLNN